MKLAVFHLLIVFAILGWLIGSVLLFYGYVQELYETDRYHLVVCRISRFDIRYDSIGTKTYILDLNLSYINSYSNITGSFSIPMSMHLSEFGTYLNTKIKVNAPYPCLVSFSDDLPYPFVKKTIGEVTNLTERRAEKLYLAWPQQTIYLTISIAAYVISFLLMLAYISVHYYIYRRRKGYHRLVGSSEETVTLVENFKPLDEVTLVGSSFAKAQEVLWTNERLFSADDFAELKNLQLKAVVNASERPAFQRLMVQVLKRLAANRVH